jgi:hypothetical protein
VHHRGSRQHDKPLVTLFYHASVQLPVPAQSLYAWRSDTGNSQTCGTKMALRSHHRVPVKGCRWHLLSIRMPTRREVKSNRQHTFPIDSTQPPRLPPSEVCQRGPPSLGASRHAEARIENPQESSLRCERTAAMRQERTISDRAGQRRAAAQLSAQGPPAKPLHRKHVYRKIGHADPTPTLHGPLRQPG